MSEKASIVSWVELRNIPEAASRFGAMLLRRNSISGVGMMRRTTKQDKRLAIRGAPWFASRRRTDGPYQLLRRGIQSSLHRAFFILFVGARRGLGGIGGGLIG
jgi:hypothetical protein